MNKTSFIKRALSVLLVSVLISACSGGESGTENISAIESTTLINSNEDNPDFAIIDLRTPEEFNQGYVQNAVLIDYYEKDFVIKLNDLTKNKTYLIYCHSGVRSGKTLKRMKKLGFEQVYNMADGMVGWNAAQLPTVKPNLEP
ncbi:MAG: rhodanese-like domain-containing protein [Gammaproteobacteria bacterium]